ncbi:phosphate ABC transporter membrane protein 2, PhoT family [Desulfitobacterium dichloroeliminans LMG P-21439]|uniref:Phosphate transport system permease protein PstA n=1 Tax=Desulfitobacterium dichloroeliminans (strain LMG P-21439 / DCA1) TaxID=871963 RepID=L0F3X5_DESDL|nr:phosphate ABC transporter permease PstA [Desulfitobacterium dichloroeliminans]AGA68509.1 phosphate ABC transporter membrane protein 2, PhoT family [Desulfitobacterium dichloroeliminans LMG P-21439]
MMSQEIPRVKIDSKLIEKRIMLNNIFKYIFSFSTVFSILVLGVLLYEVGADSVGWLDLQFLTSNLSIFPHKAGIYGAIIGTIMMMFIVIPVTTILGVSTAIYLEEYAKKGRLQYFINVNISNLASVPSVIFGLLGLTLFGRLMNLGSSILAGGLTMSLLVLPIVVVAAQEAIRAVPGFLREASYAMGADKWTTIRKVVLPVSLPGILTGTILAMSRAIGETAPLVVLGIPTLIMKIPSSVMDDFTILPIQIYYWTLDAVLKPEYANLAAATVVVLLIILFLMNSVAILIRNKFQQRF